MNEAVQTNWAYLMRCDDGSLYAGWTNDLAHRVYAHTHGEGAKYTKAFHGKGLAYAQVFATKSEAMHREAALKKLTKAQKEALCREWAERSAPRLTAATPADAEDIVDIYGWYVQNSTATFRTDVPAGPDLERWLGEALACGPVILARDADGSLEGFALAHPWRGGRGGYSWNVETTIYCAPGSRSRHVGAALYTALLGCLAAMGYCNAYAVLTDPNRASDAFHKKMGYLCESRCARTAYKGGHWYGASTWVYRLHKGRTAPQPLRTLAPAEVEGILAEAALKAAR